MHEPISKAPPLLMALALAVAVAVPTPATADEPDDDQQGVYDEEPDAPAPPLRRDVYEAGAWSIGIDGLFSRTSTRAEIIDDGQARDTTRFLRLDSRATVGVADRVHVGLVVGFLSRRINQAGADASTENAVAFQPLFQYVGPITRRLGWYGEIGPGLYFGSSERTIPVDDEEDVVQEAETSTSGFVLTVGTGLNYRLTEGFQLRFGLSFNGLRGSEEVQEVEQDLSSATTNLGTTAGFRYTF